MLLTRLALDLPEDFSHLAMVRRVTREVLCSFGVVGQDVDDVELLVGELAANSARHAHSGLVYRIQIEITDELVVVTVTDQGKGFTRDEVPPPGTIRVDDDNGESERFGGWGLPLVEMLADCVEFLPNEPCGTTVRVEKRLRNGNGASDRPPCSETLAHAAFDLVEL